ncbi:MAG: Do family serine endopeptidase [Pseudomonadota bacterium]
MYLSNMNNPHFDQSLIVASPAPSWSRLLVLLAASLFVGLYLNISQAALPYAVDGQPLPSLAPMLERVQPAVVNISTEAEIRIRRRPDPFFDDPFFNRFFNRRSYEQKRKRQGLGSGVIFDAEQGLILTNAHVIEGADTIRVTVKDGRESIATVIGADKDSDVAVIKIELDALHQISLGISETLRVGDFVVAIGNPFGLRQTVTSGIVSALGRSGLGIENYEDFIQTDASINPGNSGGALVNLRGELIGINTAIVAPSGGNVGIGFSIPIDMALQISNQLVSFGSVQRGRLGVRIQDLTPKLAEAFGIQPSKGAVITRVAKNSMADEAGIQVGDVVVAANSRQITKGAELHNAIGLLPIGQELKLDIVRNGMDKTITTTVRNLVQDASIGASINSRLAGATLSELTDQQSESATDGGVLVVDVERGSPAWNAGIRPDDIIVSANRKSVMDLNGFRMVAAQQSVLSLYIIRGSGALFLLLQ